MKRAISALGEYLLIAAVFAACFVQWVITQPEAYHGYVELVKFIISKL